MNCTLSRLFNEGKFEESLLYCLSLLASNLFNIFPSKKQLKKETVIGNGEIIDNFESLLKSFNDHSYSKKLHLIINDLVDQNCKDNIGSVNKKNIITLYNEIYMIYGYIAMCCVKLKRVEIFLCFIRLSHIIFPYFIIGDLVASETEETDWNTEKILISSIIKTSDRLLEVDNLNTCKRMNVLFTSWHVCLDCWLHYLEIRIAIMINSRTVNTKEIIGLIRHLKEIFQLISKSRLPLFYQSILIIEFCNCILINSDFGLPIIKIFQQPISKTNLGLTIPERNRLFVNICKFIEFILRLEMHGLIMDLLILFNGLTTLLINIIHQSIKNFDSEFNANQSVSSFEHSPMEINFHYLFKIKKAYFKLVDLVYIKINLCLTNGLLFYRWSFYYWNSVQKQLDINQRFNKMVFSHTFLIMGIVNSLSRSEFNDDLLKHINELLKLHCNFLEVILNNELYCNILFFKNMDGYRSILVDFIIKRIYSVINNEDTILKESNQTITLIIRILTIFNEIVHNKKLFENLNSDIGTTERLTVKIKTSICEVIFKSIQHSSLILNEHYYILEEIITSTLKLDTHFRHELTSDELILNFIFTVSENLIRLSAQLKFKKNYRDSIKLLKISLLCLSNIISIPWIGNDSPLRELENKMDFKQGCVSKNINEYTLTPVKNIIQDQSSSSSGKLKTDNFFINESNYKESNIDIKNINKLMDNMHFTSSTPETNMKYGDIFTPFVSRLKNKGLSQIRSQTIKRIQTSTTKFIIKKSLKYNKTNKLNTEFDNSKNDKLDYPVHVLLFLLALELLVSSFQLQYSEEQSQISVEIILSSTEEYLNILFANADNSSYLFVFGELLENYPFLEMLELDNRPNDDYFGKTEELQMIKHQFSIVINSIIQTYCKAKILLINEFSCDTSILFRYPEINKIFFKIIWFYSELDSYQYYWSGSCKLSSVFNKGISNGFCTELIKIYNKIFDYISNGCFEIINSSHIYLRFFFCFKIQFFLYYLWLFSNLKENRSQHIIEMKNILSELELLLNKINNHAKYLYLSRVTIYKIIMLEKINLLETSNLKWISKSLEIHQELKKSFEELSNYIVKFSNIQYNNGQHHNKTLSFDYFKNEFNTNTKQYKDINKVILVPDFMKHSIEDIDDIPLPLINNIKSQRLFGSQISCELNKSTDSPESQTNDIPANQKNNVRFTIDESNELPSEKKKNSHNHMNISELEIFIENNYEIYGIVELYEINTELNEKLIIFTLDYFSECWSFLLDSTSEDTSCKESISKKITQSINFFLNSIEIDPNIKSDKKEILLMNIGLFISKTLYMTTQLTRNSLDCSKWDNIANKYCEGLLCIIENKYLLPSSFITEKLTMNEVIFEIFINLLLLRICRIEDLGHVNTYLQLINNLELNEKAKSNRRINSLIIKLYNKLSKLFMNLNIPDFSMLFLLESYRLTHNLLHLLESFKYQIEWKQCNEKIISSSIYQGSHSECISLILSTSLQLGRFWWKLGAFERSQIIYSKLTTFCRKWTFSCNKLTKIYFFQIPQILNNLFSRSDSHFNIVYSTNNLNSLKDVIEQDINDVHERSTPTLILRDILQFIEIYLDIKPIDDNYFERDFIPMILMLILLYFILNNKLSFLKESFSFKGIFHVGKNEPVFEKKSSINIMLRAIWILVEKELDGLGTALGLIFENLNIDDYYYNFFLSNILNYILTFFSSKYVDLIGNFMKGKIRTEEISKRFFVIFENKVGINEFNLSNQMRTVENIIEEICKQIVQIKSRLFVNLSPDESRLISRMPEFDITGTWNNANRAFWTNFLEPFHRNINTNNRLHIMRRILILVNMVSKHIFSNLKVGNYSLNQISLSIILDIVLLIKATNYQNNSWDTIFCNFINSFTPVSLIGGSFDFIQYIRRIQKKFENFKIKESNMTLTEDEFAQNGIDHDSLSNSFVLIRFILSFKNCFSTWTWDESSSKLKKSLHSKVYLRFSTSFANLSFDATNNLNYAIFQMTKDFSYIRMIDRSLKNLPIYFNSSKITLFHFINCKQINGLFEDFDRIQQLNIESIKNVEMNLVSDSQIRNWWNRRISIESQLKNWLLSFPKLMNNDTTSKFLLGWRKEMMDNKHKNKIIDFVKDNLLDIKISSVIDFILFSISNNIPQLLSALEIDKIYNIDVPTIHKYFKKIFSQNKSLIKHFPITIFLDKLLINLPLEGIPELLYQPITRGVNERICLENINSLLNKWNFESCDSFHANFCNLFYCVNPTGDLKETEDKIVPYISRRFQDKCSGLSGLIPNTTNLMSDIELKQINLYLFCGHQAGEKYIQGEALERGIVTENLMINDDYYQLPPSLLVGCSSSRIRSYGPNDTFFTPLHYLIGGSPFVLGALWDVTDQDIDRFTISIFDHWFNSRLSLLESITLARQDCKLPLLNGSSCVCFGYPI
ncbi:Peptidase family C50 family protein [Cryptosporidium felis]|nr:Peptidase family C50 family protein [Cryptosporidium felis]